MNSVPDRNQNFGRLDLRGCWRHWWVGLPVLWGAGLVAVFSVNLVYWDEWGVVEAFQHIRDQGFQWGVLWAQSNEHRIFFPRLVMMGGALLTDYNAKVAALIGQLFVLAAYVIYLMRIWSVPAGKAVRVMTVLLVGAACYNTMQYENFIWSFQIAFLMVMAFAVIGFHFLDKAMRQGRAQYWIMAMGAGVIASFSSMHGLLFWPAAVAALVLVYLPPGRPIFRPILLILLCGVTSTVVYLIGYSKPASHPGYLEPGLLQSVEFGLAFLGSFAATRYPLWGMAAGALVSALVLAAYVQLVRTGRTGEYLFPFGLILFGCAMGGALAIGRSGLGMNMALASRYSTFSLLTFIGLVLILYREWSLHGAEAGGIMMKKPYMTAIVFLALYLLAENLVYLPPAIRWRQERKAGVAVLQHHREATWPDLQTVGPFSSEEQARTLVAWLEQKRWNVFAGRPAADSEK